MEGKKSPGNAKIPPCLNGPLFFFSLLISFFAFCVLTVESDALIWARPFKHRANNTTRMFVWRWVGNGKVYGADGRPLSLSLWFSYLWRISFFCAAADTALIDLSAVAFCSLSLSLYVRLVALVKAGFQLICHLVFWSRARPALSLLVVVGRTDYIQRGPSITNK